MVWISGVLRPCHENTAPFLLASRSEFTGRWSKFQKGARMSKRERVKCQRGSDFFLFYQSKLLSHFVLVSPDATLKERSPG